MCSVLNQFSPGNKLSFVIRNQPAGQVDIKTVRQLDRTIVVPQADGSVKPMKDPRPDTYSMDMIVTVTGKGQKTKEGLVLGNTKMKIGSSVEIDQLNYNFNGTVIDIRYLDNTSLLYREATPTRRYANGYALLTQTLREQYKW
jgi:hypothetical protein